MNGNRCTTEQRQKVVKALCPLGLTVKEIHSLMPEWSFGVIALDVRILGGMQVFTERPTTMQGVLVASQNRYNELVKVVTPLSEEDAMLRDALAVWLKRSNTGFFIPCDQIDLLRPVTDLGLSARPFGALQTHDIRYVGELVCMTETQVMDVQRIGREGLQEIKKCLKVWGLRLGMSITSGTQAVIDLMKRPKG